MGLAVAAGAAVPSVLSWSCCDETDSDSDSLDSSGSTTASSAFADESDGGSTGKVVSAACAGEDVELELVPLLLDIPLLVQVDVSFGRNTSKAALLLHHQAPLQPSGCSSAGSCAKPVVFRDKALRCRPPNRL